MNNTQKYTQESIAKIENFFQSKFNKTSIRVGQYGTKEGVSFLSNRGLSRDQKKELDSFFLRTFNSNFKNAQTCINQRIVKGTLTVPFYLEHGDTDTPLSQPETTSEQPTEYTLKLAAPSKFDVLVKCCRLVKENKMSNKELCEIIINLY